MNETKRKMKVKMNKMNTIRKMVLATVLAGVGLCGSLWAKDDETPKIQRLDFKADVVQLMDGYRFDLVPPTDATLATGEKWAWAVFPKSSTGAKNLMDDLNAAIGTTASKNFSAVSSLAETENYDGATGYFTSGQSLSFVIGDDSSHSLESHARIGSFVVARVRESDGGILAVGGIYKIGKVEVKSSFRNEMFGLGNVDIAYYAWNGSAVVKQTPVSAIQLTNEITEFQDGSTYISIGSHELSGVVTVRGNVRLILTPNSELTCGAGINLESGAHLQVCSSELLSYPSRLRKSNGMGTEYGYFGFLYKGDEPREALHGDATTILSIHGGHVSAYSRYATTSKGTVCGTINVYDGCFQSEGVLDAAAIKPLTAFNVLGGQVLAHVTSGGGAGIGGAAGESAAGAVNIQGGWVQAEGGTDTDKDAAGIGAGAGGEGHGTLTIASGMYAFADPFGTRTAVADYTTSREKSVLIAPTNVHVSDQDFTLARGSDGSLTLTMPGAPGDGYAWMAMLVSREMAEVDLPKLSSQYDKSMGGYVWEPSKLSEKSVLRGESTFDELLQVPIMLVDQAAEYMGLDADDYKIVTERSGAVVALPDVENADMLIVAKVLDNQAHEVVAIGGARDLMLLPKGQSKTNEGGAAAPLGTFENPWLVGETGNEGTVKAYRRGLGGIQVTGDGNPKTLGENEEPWASVVPPITQIVVPAGKVEAFKTAWPTQASIISDEWAEPADEPPAPESDFEFDPDTGTITGYTGAGGDVVIPATIGGVAVTAIGEEAFAYSDLTGITIPASVKEIGSRAFAYLEDLSSVTFAEGIQLTIIDEGVFSGCMALAEITIPETVTEIGASSFANSGLQNFTFADAQQVGSIGIQAFGGCASLTNVVIPASVTNIGMSAFTYCENLSSVIFAQGSQLATIGPCAFMGCISLKEVTIPASMKNLGISTFANSGLESVAFEDGSQLEIIGISTFLSCASLTNVVIPASVTNIEMQAFASCENLSSVTFAQGSQLETIGSSAFGGCISLKEVTIPVSVKDSGSYSFSGCSQLTAVTVLAVEPPTGVEMFPGCDSLTAILVPVGRVDAYKGADGWKEYADLITDGTVEATYYAWNEAAKVVDGPYTTNAIPVTAEMTTLNSGWYVVNEDVDMSHCLVVDGDAHLILADGKRMSVDLDGSEDVDKPGIKVSAIGGVTNSLSIYGQASGSGALISRGNRYGAGIGSGHDSYPNFGVGNINIHGGFVKAGSKQGSGIGGSGTDGGGSDADVYGGTINIYSGEVRAYAGLLGAGIGSAGGLEINKPTDVACRVTIYGGKVQTYCMDKRSFGAGIGGGATVGGGIVTIYGGEVTAEATMAAGIGGGIWGEGGTCTVYGGHVIAASKGLELAPGMTVVSSGIGGGLDAEEFVLCAPGTFALDPGYADAAILSGDDRGSATNVAAEAFGSEVAPGWCTNPYVEIGTAVAEIVVDGVSYKYPSVQAAFDSDFLADQSVTNTVTLLKDYTETQVLAKVGGDVPFTGSTLLGVIIGEGSFEPRTARLDLNGFTLTGGCSEDVGNEGLENLKVGPAIFVLPNSVLIIDDSSAEKTGLIRKPTPPADLLAENSAPANGSLGVSYVMYQAILPIISVVQGDLTLAGGTICGQAIRVNGQKGLIGISNMGRLSMTGGTIRDCSDDEATVACGIYSLNGATSISDGKVKDAIMVPSGTMSISGGLFGTDDVKNNPDWLAEGVTCEANTDDATRDEGYVWKVAPPVPTAMIVTGNGATTNIYYSVQAAFDSAFTSDPSVTNTVTLLRDYTETAKWQHGGIGNIKGATVLDVKRTARLDLNGHTLTGGGTAIEEGFVSAVLLVGPQSVLIIDDSSEAKTGAIRKLAAADNAAPLLAAKSGQLGAPPMVYYYLPAVLNLRGDLTLADGTVYGAPCSLGSEVLGVIGVGVMQGRFTMTGGKVVDCFVEGVTPSVGIGGATSSELIITGGKVKDAIMFMDEESTASISGGLFGTDDVKNNPAWLAEGAVCSANTDDATREEGYVWKVGIPPGSPANPWKVGPDGSDLPQAYTNGNGGLVIEGEGTVEKKPWLDEGVKDGITEITITDPDTELPDDAFEGMGSDDEKIKIVLPDNWQGELPDEDGNWYGAKAEIETWPFMIRNVRFQQRYPWDGYVDIYADVYGPETNDVNVYVSAFNGEIRIPASAFEPAPLTVDLTNGVTKAHFGWDAVSDLDESFRSMDVSVTVALHGDDSEPHALPAIAERRIWEGNQQFVNWLEGDEEVLVKHPGGFDWSSAESGSRLSIYYTLTGKDNVEAKLGIYTCEGYLLPSLQDKYMAKIGITLEGGSSVFRMNLTKEDLELIVKEGGLSLKGAHIDVTEIWLRDPMPDDPAQPEGLQVSSASEAGRLDLRQPLIVAAGSVDEITYSATHWGNGNRDYLANIRFCRIYSEEIPEVSTIPIVYENLEGTGVKEFTYPERAGLYAFFHETVPPPNANKKVKPLFVPVYVVWYIGADDPESVYAIDYGNGEILIAGNGRMKDFVECGPWGTDITGVTIRYGVENIGANAFKGCTTMTHAELPESMKVIGDGAFAGATGLRTIRNEAWEPPVFDGDPFTDIVKDNVIVYVPDDVYSEYEYSEYWSPFWLRYKGDYDTLRLEAEIYPGVEFTVTVGRIDAEPTVYNSTDYTDYFEADIPYGEMVTLTARITDGVSVFDDCSTEKTIVWNFYSYGDYVSEEIAPHGSDWAMLQNALVGTPPEDLRGALAYENEDGTNVVRLLRDIVTQTQFDRTLVVTGAAVLDLAGHDIVYSNGLRSVISVGIGGHSGRVPAVKQGEALQSRSFVETAAVPGWLRVVDTSAEGDGRIAKVRYELRPVEEKAKAEEGEAQPALKAVSLQSGLSLSSASCGIAVNTGSTFVMEGGVLTNCYGLDAGGVYNEGTVVLEGGAIAGNAVELEPVKAVASGSDVAQSADAVRGSARDGIVNAGGGTLVITGGKVLDGIYNFEENRSPAQQQIAVLNDRVPAQQQIAVLDDEFAGQQAYVASGVSISGGFFGTEDVMMHPEWVAEGYICIENDDEATIAERYGWRVVTNVKGSKWNPWDIGAGDDPGAVKAYTNDNQLVIRGEGDVKDKPLPWDDFIDSIPEIVIEDGVTGLPDDAFAGGGTEDEPMVIELPDLWPGEMPGPNGEWYGGYARFADGHYPLVVRNIRFQQRYPWNNLVDIDFDLYGSTNSVTLDIVAKCGSKTFEVKTLVGGESGFTFTDVEGRTSHHVVWDAGADILNARQRKFRCDDADIYIGPQGTVSVGGSVIKEIDDYYVYMDTETGGGLGSIYPFMVTSEDFADFKVGDRMVLTVYNNGRPEMNQQVGFYPDRKTHTADTDGALYYRRDFPEGLSDTIVEFTQEMKNLLDRQGYFYIWSTYQSLRVKSVATSGKSGKTAFSEVPGPLNLVTGARWAREREGILADPAWAGGATLTLGWLNGEETVEVAEATNATWIAGRYGEGTYRFTLTGTALDYAVTFFIPKDGQTVLADELLTSDVTIDSGTVRVYGETVIASGTTLTIAEGVEVTFDPGSGFRVEEGGHIFAPGYDVSVDPDTGLVTLTERPRPVISNIRFSQRYPWNGLVDIYADVAYAADPSTGVWVRIEAEMVAGQSQVLTAKIGYEKIDYEEKESARSTAIMARTLYLAADPSVTNDQFKVAQGPVHLVWDAKADLPPETFGDFSITVLAALDKMVVSAPSGYGCLCFTAVPHPSGRESSEGLVVRLARQFIEQVANKEAAAEGDAVEQQVNAQALEKEREKEPLVSDDVNIQISWDGKNWEDYVIGKYVTVPFGSKIYWRGDNPKGLTTESTTYTFETQGGAFEASGSVMSLIDPTCTATAIPSAYCFGRLFVRCNGILTAPELPATELTPFCYCQMFQTALFLQTAPVLPAAVVPNSAYARMFFGCTKLNEVTMNATTLMKMATDNWLSHTAQTGTLYLNRALDGVIEVDSFSGIPEGWSAVYSGTPVKPRTDIIIEDR